MSLTTALAARATAEWLRDPQSPKCHLVQASTEPSAPGKLPPLGTLLCGTDPKATHWCAIGRYFWQCNKLGAHSGSYLDWQGSEMRNMITFHNAGHYERAAQILDTVAARAEARLPVAERERELVAA